MSDPSKISNPVTVFGQAMEAFKELQLTTVPRDKFPDIELVVSDTIIPAHKFILASISPYFEKMLFGSFVESKEAKVKLTCDPVIFTKFLDIFYGIVGKFYPEELFTIIDMCDEYQVVKLQAVFEAILFRSLKKTELYSAYKRLKQEKAKKKCWDDMITIIKNFSQDCLDVFCQITELDDLLLVIETLNKLGDISTVLYSTQQEILMMICWWQMKNGNLIGVVDYNQIGIVKRHVPDGCDEKKILESDEYAKECTFFAKLVDSIKIEELWLSELIHLARPTANFFDRKLVSQILIEKLVKNYDASHNVAFNCVPGDNMLTTQHTHTLFIMTRDKIKAEQEGYYILLKD